MRTKCDEKLIQDFCKVLEAGNFITAALDFVGISYKAYAEWLRRGQEEIDRQLEGKKPRAKEAIFAEFVAQVQRAKASAEVRSVMIINKAAQEDWRAAAWYLERSQAETWGRKVKTVEHKGAVEIKEPAVDLSKLSEEALAELEKAALK
jgi:hypothetical protein